jgi:2-(3-amino-3-carboxypropyl)histidine synthase
MLDFDFEIQRIQAEIRRLGAKRVLLQMPQGLKPEATKIAQAVEAEGALTVISSDSCYGACDIAAADAEDLGADLVVHFAHSKMVKESKIPTLYVEAHSDVSIDTAIQQVLPLLDCYNNVGLTTSVQHIHLLDRAKLLLTLAGKKVYVGDAKQLAHAGQVIGCNYSNASVIAGQVDAFLFVGGGIFHALGIALGTSKPTVVADPYDNRSYAVTDQAQKLLKQRFASIQEAQAAKIVGVLVGLKPGQQHLDDALKAKVLAEKTGRQAYLLAGREITPEALVEFPQFDAYVNTACPRISLDAPGKFKKPILTVNEFMVVCGEVTWTDMLKKGLFAN